MGMTRFTSSYKGIKIAASETKSSAIVIDGFAFGMLEMPAAATGTEFTFEGTIEDDENWRTLVGLSVTFTASGMIRIPDAAFGCCRIRIVSNDTEASEIAFGVRLSA